MKGKKLVAMGLMAMLFMGCVSTQTHESSLKELEDAKKASAMTAKEFAQYKEQSAKDFQALQEDKNKVDQQREALQAEKERLEQNVLVAKQREEDLQGQLSRLQGEHEALQTEQSRLQSSIAALTEERDRQKGDLGVLSAKNDTLTTQGQDLRTKLKSIEAQMAALQADKQKLLAGTTTAQDEIARMQQRMGTLETEVARISDLEARLSERDSQISSMQERTSQLEMEAARAKELEGTLSKRDQEIETLRQAVADREKLAGTVAALTQERDDLSLKLQGQSDLLQSEEEERQRLVEERAAKEAEIQRLTQTHSQLAESLKAEIAKGNIQIQQVRDKLTINLVDKILFDSGRVDIKAQGLDVLKQVSDVLVNVTDKQIRIEGHTDNVPIRGKLQERYPSNWELSTARATNVVRYLIQKGELSPTNLTAVGHADTQPVANNDEEEGRSLNRRIEIVLFPKDLSEIATDIQTGGS